ncbi:lebercilin-like protein isoform X2 [Hermetia illucens]|uniref:lebercilin-like protein isoform X2 n=1 Tax=Hermetia illucens TaxID=343691 RepID=UPI0018CC5A88|nr:lebercilin-like protein isoform X2 [Hermetia illucens]
MSTLSLIPEEKKFLPNTSKSTESLYSSSSSKYSATGLYKRKLTGIRQPGFVLAQNEVRQRVLSARRLRVKTLQNQLADAQLHISELANENRILRTLHKRQDTALSKYEGTNAELPQLLHSHAEEIRMWQTKCRNLNSQNRELTRKLKERDTALLALGDQNKHLTQLSRDRNLEDRERLTERVRYLESRLNEKDNDVKLLARRIQLEAKNYKAQIYKEQQKYKQLIQKLEQARCDVDKLSQSHFDMREKNTKSMMPRSLSGSKLPKPCKERERGQLGHERDDNSTKTSISTPSLCQETNYQIIQPSQELKARKSAGNLHTDSQKRSVRQSRQNSGARKSRRDELDDLNTMEFNAEELSNAISKGMSKLLCNNEFDKDEASLNGNEPPSDPENILDQSEPENYYGDDGNYDEANSFGSDENDESADIVGGKSFDAYESNEIIHQSRRDFVNIQKKMSDDYQERESFLDTFCKQSVTIEKELSARRSSNIDSKKKNQLLAALKAIDNEDTVN